MARGSELADCTAGSREFRDWRVEAESIVSNAESLGFRLPGDFESDARNYRATYNNAVPKNHRDVFTRDLGDSLAELRFLVDQFDRYGAPAERASVTQPSPRPLASPEKVTVRWLIDNVSIRGWVIAGGVAIALLSAGYTAGQYDILRRVIAALFGS